MREILRDAASTYRAKAGEERVEYALFKDDTQLAGVYPTEQEVIRVALAEGLIPEAQTADESGADVFPAGYHVQRLKQSYDTQPNWKPPEEIS